MSNRFGFATVVAALLVFSVGSALPAYAQAPECADKNAKITKKISKPMDAAINALKAQNWHEVLTKVTEAEAEPSPKGLYDKYWIHNLKGKATRASSSTRKRRRSSNRSKTRPA